MGGGGVVVGSGTKRHNKLQLEKFAINPVAFLSVREHSILYLQLFNCGVIHGGAKILILFSSGKTIFYESASAASE